jgi:NitT/TauT family transport system substrate-binding protein
LLALQNKGVDAATPLEPITSEIIQRGLAVKVVGDDELYPFHQVSTLFYSSQFAAKKDVATRFMRAYIRGLRDYNDAIVNGRFGGPKADKIIDISINHTTIKNPEVFRQMIVSYCDANDDMDRASLVADLASFKREGQIEHAVEVEDALDTSFLEAAQQSLGPYTWPAENTKPSR